MSRKRESLEDAITRTFDEFGDRLEAAVDLNFAKVDLARKAIEDLASVGISMDDAKVTIANMSISEGRRRRVKLDSRSISFTPGVTPTKNPQRPAKKPAKTKKPKINTTFEVADPSSGYRAPARVPIDDILKRSGLAGRKTVEVTLVPGSKDKEISREQRKLIKALNKEQSAVLFVMLEEPKVSWVRRLFRRKIPSS